MLLYSAIRFSPKIPLQNTFKKFFLLFDSVMHSYDEFSSSQPHPLLRTSSPIGTLLNHASFYWHVLVSCRVTGVKHNFLPEQQLEALYWSRENSPTVTSWKKVTAVPQQLLIVKHPSHEVGSHGVKRWDQVYLLMSIGICSS